MLLPKPMRKCASIFDPLAVVKKSAGLGRTALFAAWYLFVRDSVGRSFVVVKKFPGEERERPEPQEAGEGNVAGRGTALPNHDLETALFPSTLRIAGRTDQRDLP